MLKAYKTLSGLFLIVDVILSFALEKKPAVRLSKSVSSVNVKLLLIKFAPRKKWLLGCNHFIPITDIGCCIITKIHRRIGEYKLYSPRSL